MGCVWDMADMESRASRDPGVWLDVAAERGSEPAQQHALKVTDISSVSVLRKRVGRAAASMKYIGVLSAMFVWFDFPTAGSGAFSAVGLAVGILSPGVPDGCPGASEPEMSPQHF